LSTDADNRKEEIDMPDETVNLGDAELEIMKVIWRAERPISAAEIGLVVAERGWKRTTIATFLARLVEKGALAVERRGKSQYYTPLFSAGTYKRSQLKRFVKRLFDGSAKELVASLFEEEELSREELEELRSAFDEKEE